MRLAEDIPYPILDETIKHHIYSRFIMIDRKYQLPKVGLFESPVKYLDAFYKYDNQEICEDWLSVITRCGGWGDPDCRSFWLHFVLEPINQKE